MTTVAAVIHDGRIAIATDGAANWGGIHTTLSDPKMAHWANGLIIAASGERRAGNLISALKQESFGEDPGFGGEPTPETVWQAIKAALVADGFEFKIADGDSGGSPHCGCSFVFALGETLWEVDGGGGRSAFDQDEPVGIGSGSSEAVGALSAMLECAPDLPAEVMVERAVRIGIRYDSGSAGKVFVASRSTLEQEVEYDS